MLTVALMLAMGSVLGNDIVYDGAALLGHDQRFQAPIDWHGLLTEPFWYYALWRPVTSLTLGVEAHLAGGITPWVFHISSLFLYLVTALLVVFGANRLGARPWSALLAGLGFAVHPIHVEVVASVVGQAELLASMAMLGSAVLWHRATIRGSSNALFLGLVALQLIAAGAKEQGFMLPILLAGQHWLLRPKLSHRVAARWLGVLFLVSLMQWLGHAAVTGAMMSDSPAPYFLGTSSIDRLLAGLGVLPRALALLVMPVRLGFEHGPPAIGVQGQFGWLQVTGLIMIALWGILVWRWGRRRPLAAFGLWWAAITWLPASSLIVPAGLLLADRVLFLPSIGVALALASVTWPVGSRWRLPVLAGAAAMLCIFGIRSTQRVAIWHDADTFFAAMTRDNPNAYRAWYVRAMHEKSSGRLDEAEVHLRQALALWARDPKVHEELGQLLRVEGRCTEAIPIFRDGLALDATRFQLRAKLTECERVANRDTANAARAQ